MDDKWQLIIAITLGGIAAVVLHIAGLLLAIKELLVRIDARMSRQGWTVD